MGQNPNFRGGQNRTSRWGQNQVSRGGQNGSRGGQIQKFFGATRRRKTALRAGDFAPPLEKILATPLTSVRQRGDSSWTLVKQNKILNGGADKRLQRRKKVATIWNCRCLGSPCHGPTIPDCEVCEFDDRSTTNSHKSNPRAGVI